jgi:hypothetical protein
MSELLSQITTLIEQVGKESAVAAVVAAVLVFGLGLPWSGNRTEIKKVGWVLGIGLGFFAGCWLLSQDPSVPLGHDADWPLGQRLRWPPAQDRDRLLFILLPAVMMVELLAALPRVRPTLAWVPRLVLAALAGRIMLHGSTNLGGVDDSSGIQPWQLLAGLAVTLAAVWILLATLARLWPSRALPVAVGMTCGAAGLAIMLSGSVTAGQLAFPLAAALLGAAAASLPLIGRAGVPACIGVGVVGLFGLVISGRFFAELTTTHALILFFAPLLCWLAAFPGVRRLPAFLRGAVPVLLLMIPLGLVVSQARQKFIEDSMPRPTTPGAPNIPEATIDDYQNFGK